MALQELDRPTEGQPRRPGAATPARPRPMAAGRVLVVGAIALGVAAVVNATPLLELARRQPEGSRTRALALAVAEPLEGFASAVGLTRPREALDSALGRDDAPARQAAAATAPTTVAAPAPAGTAVAPTTAGTPGSAVSTSAVPTSAVPATTVPAGTQQPPLGRGPVRLLVVGDSMAQGLGAMLTPLAEGEGGYVPTVHGKASTGLTRPDFYDWPLHLREDTAAHDPGIVVLMFGGNDGQPIRHDDGTYSQVSEPRWAEEYGRRVGAVMDQLGREGRRVVWVGTPNAKSANMNKRLTVINQVLRDQAATRPWVSVVDAWSLFAPGGVYTAKLPDDTGKVRTMRNSDGYHLTMAGYQHLARAVLAEVDEVRAAG